jgi:hypothetical protein
MYSLADSRRVLALKRAIEATFDPSSWEELGMLTGTSELITTHPRLFRSYRFGDDDYGSCVADILPVVLGENLENFELVAGFVRLDDWLAENDPSLRDLVFGAPMALRAEDLAVLTDASAIEMHLRRLQSAIGSDPEHAIGTAKELIESTVKLVLRQLGETYNPKGDLHVLAKQAQQALALHPEMIAPTSKGFEASKKVLSGLTGIAIGVAELRNLYGTGHGKESTPSGLKARHAQMAVDSATTYCRALLATLADPTAPWRRSAGSTAPA